MEFNSIEKTSLTVKKLEEIYSRLSRISIADPEKLYDFFSKNCYHYSSNKNNSNNNNNIKKIHNWILEKAIKQRELKIVDFLLSIGIKIDVINEYEQTAIHLAILQGFYEIIDRLFENCNNSVNYTDVNGLSHFHVACMTGNLEIVKGFVDRGVVVDVDIGAFLESDNNYYSPLHLAVKFVQCEIVDFLLSKGADPDVVDEFNSTPLHYACRGYTEQIDILKKKHRLPHDYRNDNNSTMVAGHYNDVDDDDDEDDSGSKIVRLLIGYNCNVNAKDRWNETPIFSIFKKNVDDYLSCTIRPLYIWSLSNRKKMLKDFRSNQRNKLELLLKSNADTTLRNDKKDTILHLAIDQLMVSRKPQCLLDIDFDDSSIVEMITLILTHGSVADVIDAKNDRLETPLQKAISLLSLKSVEKLLAYGARVGNVRFETDEGYHCFQYFPNVLPCLEAVDNLLRIIDVLKLQGFRMTPGDDLAVLTFLNENNKDCQYSHRLDNNRIFKMKNLLELGTPENIKQSLEAHPINGDDTTLGEQFLKRTAIFQLRRHLSILEKSNVYSRIDVKNFLTEKIEKFQNCLIGFLAVNKSEDCESSETLREEINTFKEIFFNQNKSLYKILTSSPDEVQSFLKKSNYESIVYSENFTTRFPHCSGVIKGHIAKCLIKKHVIMVGMDYLIGITHQKLPQLCCKEIAEYLNEKNVISLVSCFKK